MSTSVFELAENPGLETAFRAVERAVSTESGAQVLLLFGAKGGGMEVLAEYLSRRWMGKGGVSFEGDLGHAVDFQKIEPLGASRLHRLEIVREENRRAVVFGEDEGDSGGEKKPKKDEFQGIPIIKFFRTRPLMAANKVVWILDADRMNPRTANALLKTLEEVPSYARLVMTTSDFGRVLPTIRSRSICVACGATVTGEMSEAERVFASTPGRLEFVREHAAVFDELFALLEGTAKAPAGNAISCSEKARDLAGVLASRADLGARAANAEILESIALWTVVRHQNRPEVAQVAAESYRLVVGNGNAGLAFDHLFGSIFGIQ